MMEQIHNVFFFVFAALVILPIVFMVFTKDIIRAAFAFALSLLGIAAIYVLLNADYMAVVQIMIYAGGILVLLIFGVMLTKRGGDEGLKTLHRDWKMPVIVVLGLLFILLRSIGYSRKELEVLPHSSHQIKSIGVGFLTEHIVAFELVAFLLLVALVGAAFVGKKSDEEL